MAIKHIGKLKSNKRKVAVAYRTLPNDPEHALIVSTETLTDSDHDVLMQLVESPAGQDAGELAEAMARTRLSDGSVMLARFHATGKLQRVPTADVDMMPTNTDTVNLAELNKIIADQKVLALLTWLLKMIHKTLQLLLIHLRRLMRIHRATNLLHQQQLMV